MAVGVLCVIEVRYTALIILFPLCFIKKFRCFDCISFQGQEFHFRTEPLNSKAVIRNRILNDDMENVLPGPLPVCHTVVLMMLYKCLTEFT
jgi:hypothetical protein